MGINLEFELNPDTRQSRWRKLRTSLPMPRLEMRQALGRAPETGTGHVPVMMLSGESGMEGSGFGFAETPQEPATKEGILHIGVELRLL